MMGEKTAAGHQERGSIESAPVRFGGWIDYREWAAHDFQVRSSADDPNETAPGTIVVEALTDLVPIRLLVEEDQTAGSRRGCLMPSNGMTPFEDEPVADTESALIRPYVRMSPQSDVRHQLEFETVVEAVRPYASLPVKELSYDHRQICRICVVPQSVAEVAVAISAPLGLARKIISETIDQGYLRVHDTVSMVDGLPSIALLRRVYSGLARLPDVRPRVDEAP